MSFSTKRLALGMVVLVTACSSGRLPEAAAPAPAPTRSTAANRPPDAAHPPVRRELPGRSAEAPSRRRSISGPTVQAAVNRYLQAEHATGADRKHVVERVDLNGDNRDDALVLMQSRRYCSVSGCKVLVFQNTGDGYSLTSEMRLGRTPMIAANTRTNGWRDLVAPMTTSRAGMQLVMLKHSDAGYPPDGERAPVVSPNREINGRVLFSDD